MPPTVAFPDEKIKLAPALWDIDELLKVKSSTSSSPAVILPEVVIELEPLLISPKLGVIEPLESGPTVTILLLPEVDPKIESASALVYLSVNAALTLVSRLAKWLILSFVTVTPSRILSSLADDVTSAPLILIVVACIVPATVNFPLARDNKSRSSLWPIVAPVVTTLPTLSEPAAIALEPISISPNPSVILPESRAPTVTIFEVPVVAPNTASASALVYLLDNSVATFVAPIFNVVASRVPSTTTVEALMAIRSLFVEWPIFEEPIVMSPVTSEPPVIALVVVILPNEPPIDPAVKLPPAATSVLRANLASASASVYLSSSWVWILLVTPST